MAKVTKWRPNIITRSKKPDLKDLEGNILQTA
jgi:hypothetical protein